MSKGLSIRCWHLPIFQYVITILNDAKIPSSHAKKAAIDAADVQLEIQCPPPINFSLDIERQQNQTLCH